MAFFGQCECGEEECRYCGPIIEEINSRKNKPKWTMRDGTVILIEKMENTHLLNCIKMLQRNNKIHFESYNNLVEEAKKRKLKFL